MSKVHYLNSHLHKFREKSKITIDVENIGDLAHYSNLYKEDKKTTFVAEMYTTYKQEVKLGEEVETHLTYIDHDKKRIHYRLSMFHKEKKYLAATNEVLSLYVDLDKRKVTEFHADRITLMDECIKKNLSKFDTDKLVFLNKLKKI